MFAVNKAGGIEDSNKSIEKYEKLKKLENCSSQKI